MYKRQGSNYFAETNTLQVSITQFSNVAIINNVISAINAGDDFYATLGVGANGLQKLTTGDDEFTEFALTGGVDATPSDFPEFDQRGAPFSRVVGTRIDIGAVEAIGAPIVVDTLVDESDGDYRKGDVSLREAIGLANARPGAETIVFVGAALVGNRTIHFHAESC